MNSRNIFAGLLLTFAITAKADLAAIRAVSGTPKEMTEKYATLADKGDVDAMQAMSFCHRFGFGVPYDPEASRQWALRAWKNGDAFAGFLAMGMLPTKGGEVFRRPANHPEILAMETAFLKSSGGGTSINRTVQNLITEKAVAAGIPSARALKLSLEYKNTPPEARKAYLQRAESLHDSGDIAASFFLMKVKPGAGTQKDADTYRRCLVGGIHEAAWSLSLILHSHPEWAESASERDELLEKSRHESWAAQACVSWFLQKRSPDENPRKAIAWLTPLAEQDDEWSLGTIAHLLRHTPGIPDAEAKAAAYETRKAEVLKLKAAAGNPNAINELIRSR